jgi:hypothetical protein
MRGLRQHLLGDAISLLLVDIAGLVDPKLGLQSHHLLLAALLAFAGESGRARTARALALEKPFLHRRDGGHRRCLCLCLRSRGHQLDPLHAAELREFQSDPRFFHGLAPHALEASRFGVLPTLVHQLLEGRLEVRQVLLLIVRERPAQAAKAQQDERDADERMV